MKMNVLITFLLINIFSTIITEGLNNSYITITDGNRQLAKVGITIAGKKTRNDFKLRTETKMCDLSEGTTIEDCLYYQEVYAEKLIFLIKDKVRLRFVEVWERGNYFYSETNLGSHIIHESLKGEEMFFNKPIFYVNDKDYNELKQYDIKKEKGNYFVNFFCK
jgi:hypothetical protein